MMSLVEMNLRHERLQLIRIKVSFAFAFSVTEH